MIKGKDYQEEVGGVRTPIFPLSFPSLSLIEGEVDETKKHTETGLHSPGFHEGYRPPQPCQSRTTKGHTRRVVTSSPEPSLDQLSILRGVRFRRGGQPVTLSVDRFGNSDVGSLMGTRAKRIQGSTRGLSCVFNRGS